MATIDEIKKKIIEAKENAKKAQEVLKKARAEAKEAGITLVKEKTPDTPEVTLFKQEAKSFLEVNLAFISGLFAKTVTAEKPLGQDSIGFTITDRYTLIIRDMEIVKAKKPVKTKEEAKTEEAKTE